MDDDAPKAMPNDVHQNYKHAMYHPENYQLNKETTGNSIFTYHSWMFHCEAAMANAGPAKNHVYPAKIRALVAWRVPQNMIVS